MNIVHYVIHMHVHVPVFVHFRNRSKDIQLVNQIKLLFFVFQDDGNDSDDFM